MGHAHGNGHAAAEIPGNIFAMLEGGYIFRIDDRTRVAVPTVKRSLPAGSDNHRRRT